MKLLSEPCSACGAGPEVPCSTNCPGETTDTGRYASPRRPDQEWVRLGPTFKSGPIKRLRVPQPNGLPEPPPRSLFAHFIEGRPAWDKYFLDLAKLAASRATCPVRQVGVVFVDPDTKIVLATGYNGAPRGLPHCGKACLERSHGERSGECRAVHAEANGIAAAAYSGISLRGSEVYCTLSPCLNCARLMIQAGVLRVAYVEESAYPQALKELAQARIGRRMLRDA